MTVVRRMPENRLGKLIRNPGGITVGEAIRAADANLQDIRDECVRVMDAKLAEIQTVAASGGARPDQETIKHLYDLNNDVLEIAGVFDMPSLGEASRSLCDLLDRCMTLGRWSAPALQVHLAALTALRAVTGDPDPQTSAMLKGLKRVNDQVIRAEG